MIRTMKLLAVGLLVLTATGCLAQRMRSPRTGTDVVVAPPQPAPIAAPGYPACPPAFPRATAPPGAATGALLPPGAGPATGMQLPPGAVLQPPAGANVLPSPGRPPVAPPGPSGPTNFPTVPQGAPPAPPAGGFPPPAPPAGAFPPPAPPTSSNAQPNSGLDRVGYRWEPLVTPTPSPYAPSAPSYLPPNNAPSAAPGPTVFLLPPTNDGKETNEPPAASPKVALYPPQNDSQPKPASEPPPAAELRSSSFPVGIANYDRVRANGNVTTGSRPSLEGLDWLKKEGIATVVFAHLPGATVEPDREQVTRRGITFLDLEFDPKMLSKQSIDEFLRLQRDPSAGKVFVYDDVEGAVTGSLWYLSFRVLDQESDEVARIRAGSLGLRENRDGAFRDMSQAVRTYLDMR